MQRDATPCLYRYNLVLDDALPMPRAFSGSAWSSQVALLHESTDLWCHHHAILCCFNARTPSLSLYKCQFPSIHHCRSTMPVAFIVSIKVCFSMLSWPFLLVHQFLCQSMPLVTNHCPPITKSHGQQSDLLRPWRETLGRVKPQPWPKLWGLKGENMWW